MKPSLCEFHHPVFQAVSRRPLTVENRVRARVSSSGICGGQNDTNTDLRVIRFSLSISYQHGFP
jgi:hypothetical protein